MNKSCQTNLISLFDKITGNYSPVTERTVSGERKQKSHLKVRAFCILRERVCILGGRWEAGQYMGQEGRRPGPLTVGEGITGIKTFLRQENSFCNREGWSPGGKQE